MIKLKITETKIKVWDLCPLTVGNINSLSVELSFSEHWNGLNKYAVFANGDTVVSVPLSTDTCHIPWEVLAHTGELYVALRGMTDGGNVVYCTENAFFGLVYSDLAVAITEESREHTPDILDDLEARLSVVENGGTRSGTIPEVSNAIATGGIGWTETDGYNITWDGVIGDKDVATLSALQYVKVADYMTPEELDGAVLSVDYGSGVSRFTLNAEYMEYRAVTNADGNTLYYNDIDPALLSAEAAGVYVGGSSVVTVPSAGVYFIYGGVPYAYTLAKGTEIVHKIADKYLPDVPVVPTNVSAFTNDSGYLTLATLPKYDGGVE